MSLKIFIPLYKQLGRLGVDRKFIHLGVKGSREYVINTGENVYFYDFTIKNVKIICEFNGLMYHVRDLSSFKSPFVKNPLKKSNSSRLTLGYKNQGYDKNLINFGFYPVYNSINGDNSQYFNEFDLQLMNLEGGYYTDLNRARLDNFDLVKFLASKGVVHISQGNWEKLNAAEVSAGEISGKPRVKFTDRKEMLGFAG